ncbi:DUF5304 domain-containing protein [Streptomyces sp. C10-9-1]|uniref:DUF5304 domain-containing protein n=1 Tax=Streptomyces sp. C10-9-1 TaxID=1859285 RepID=UPI00211247E1|nr:DUF5304 domain-containing protein [Streptomyces sp. C10-9-1]MCQ6556917.1 DUF5304 domain-containing protein [Streptomyces sp. C10-9-1]
MSDATQRPDVDEDAWATACEEDLRAEQARRRATHGAPPGSAADELRRLLDAVADKVSAFPSSLPGKAAQSAVQQFVDQAKAVVEPVVERNPQVFDHLAAAGGELLAAYRSAVEGQEQRWTRGAREPQAPQESGRGPGEDPGPTERIDLD